MTTNPQILTPAQIRALRLLDSCAVANAVETFNRRLRNEGFANGSVRCHFPEMEPMVGYAATIKIRGSAPPTADGLYPDRTDWWDYILSLPFPRVVVVQDAETRTGLGSLLGEVHVNILKSLGCVGAVTNGSVRDLPQCRKLGFQLYSGGVTVSHAYVHIVEFGRPVEVAGLKVESGDLLHGDQHGFLKIPCDLVPEIPAVAARIRQKEETIIGICQSGDFSVEKLRAVIAGNKH